MSENIFCSCYLCVSERQLKRTIEINDVQDLFVTLNKQNTQKPSNDIPKHFVTTYLEAKQIHTERRANF